MAREYPEGMANLDRIFRDYEVQLNAAKMREMEQDAQEVRRHEFSRVQHMDRFAAQIGELITCFTVDSQRLIGVLDGIGQGWIQLNTRAESLVLPLTAIDFWEGGNKFSHLDASSVNRKLSFAFALRALSRARAHVRFYHVSGSMSEGVIERVGADFVEVSVRGEDEKGRTQRGMRVLPLSSVIAVGS